MRISNPRADRSHLDDLRRTISSLRSESGALEQRQQQRASDDDAGSSPTRSTSTARSALKSEFFNEALYEAAWVSIKGKEYDKAARSLDLLM